MDISTAGVVGIGDIDPWRTTIGQPELIIAEHLDGVLIMNGRARIQ